MPVQRKHVFIIIRYSILTSSGKGWKLAERDFLEYKNKLFDPLRLAERLNIFMKVTLPSLKSMRVPADIKRTILIITSDQLPLKAFHELESATNSFHDISIIKASPNDLDIGKVVKHEIQAELSSYEDKSNDVCIATVRLDDDDALIPDYLINLCDYIALAYAGFVVSFPLGWIAEIDDANQLLFNNLFMLNQPKIALGLAYINIYSFEKELFYDQSKSNVYELGNHEYVGIMRPVICDSRAPSYLRTTHQSNDSKIGDSHHHLIHARIDDFMNSFKDCFSRDMIKDDIIDNEIIDKKALRIEHMKSTREFGARREIKERLKHCKWELRVLREERRK